MKTLTQRYEAPKAEVITIEMQGVLCASVEGAASAGSGTTNMNMQSGYGW